MSEPVRIETGTGRQRRRLTEEEAARGCLPERFTDAEWAAMSFATKDYARKIRRALDD